MDGRSISGKFYELKTYNKRWTGQLSRTWYWQGVQQAICTGSNEINWIIFDSDLQLQFHTQTVTSDEKQIHIEAARKFLGFIDMGMMPDVADLMLYIYIYICPYVRTKYMYIHMVPYISQIVICLLWNFDKNNKQIKCCQNVD